MGCKPSPITQHGYNRHSIFNSNTNLQKILSDNCQFWDLMVNKFTKQTTLALHHVSCIHHYNTYVELLNQNIITILTTSTKYNKTPITFDTQTVKILNITYYCMQHISTAHCLNIAIQNLQPIIDDFFVTCNVSILQV